MTKKRHSHYVLSVNLETTEHRVAAESPAKALRELVAAAGLTLASQDGRYGKTTDGQSVSALTAKWGRVDYPDARTTRL